MSSSRESTIKIFIIAAHAVLIILCLAYAAIAFQAAQAAAAMPFAVGGFDERHFWVPLGLAVLLLLTALIFATKG